MIETFNTGETQETLRNDYNPDGSVLRRAQLRLLDMAIYLQETAKRLVFHAVLTVETYWEHCVMGASSHGMTI